MPKPSDVTACSGAPVVVNFSGPPGATFNWTNSNPNIGLPASGSGNLSFMSPIVTNTEMATITVTPVAGVCAGQPETFKITVFPVPSVTDPPDITTCAGSAVDVVFTGSGTNPLYNWANSNPAIGLAASGSGPIHFTAAAVLIPQTATVSVTATENGCTGMPQTVTILVKPMPSVGQPPNLVLCAGEPIKVHFVGTANAAFSWINSNPNIGLATSGSGDIDGISTANGGSETATITVTPLLNGCLGAAKTFTILVKPLPTMDAITNISTCSGKVVSINFSSNEAIDFNWTNTNTLIGLQSSGSGAIEFTVPVLTVPQTGVISVFPIADGCAGPKTVFLITVAPPFKPVAADVKLGCDSLPTLLNALPNTTPATFSWSGPSGFVSSLQNPAIDTIGNYIVIVTNPVSGCTGTDTAHISNCCITKAGSFDTARIVLCNYKPLIGHFKNNEILETDDGLQFILFKDTLDMLGSILERSDSAYFSFDADTMSIDSVYFIATIAGDTITHDSIEITDPCLSVSKRMAVVWKLTPTIVQIPTASVVCHDGCMEIAFQFTGSLPFSYRLRVEQNGQFIYDKTIQAIDFQQTVTLCPPDFDPPMMGGELHFLIGNLADFFCRCGE